MIYRVFNRLLRFVRAKARIVTLVLGFIVLTLVAGYVAQQSLNSMYLTYVGDKATDMSSLLSNSLDLTKDDVIRLKQSNFSSMPEDSSYKRLVSISKGFESGRDKSLVCFYVFSELAEDEVKYKMSKEEAEVAGMAEGTPLNSIFILSYNLPKDDLSIYTDENDKERYTYIDADYRSIIDNRSTGFNKAQDKYGNFFISGYAPVYDKDTGEYIATAGVDIMYSDFVTYKHKVNIYLAVFFLFSMLGLSTLVGSANRDYIKLLKSISVTDELTGLFNRAYFRQIVPNLLANTHKKGLDLHVIMLDIDWFKFYNDTYGHSKGDDCLVKVAKTISSVAKKYNGTAVRYGGEEFLVYVSSAESNAGMQLAEALNKAIFALNIPHEKSDFKQVSVSLGVYHSKAKDPEDIRRFIQNADKALYTSKKIRGRNIATLYDESMSDIVLDSAKQPTEAVELQK